MLPNLCRYRGWPLPHLDEGASFTKVIATGYISDIAVSPSNTSVVYAAWHASYNTLDAQIYKSTDGGLTFVQISNLSSALDLRILKLLVHPTDANKVYFVSGKARSACGVAKIFRSTDGGNNFTDISFGSEKSLDLASTLPILQRFT